MDTLPNDQPPTRSARRAWIFAAGRTLLGLCFILDAGWTLATYDLRVAYLDEVGGPHFLILLSVAIYFFGGLALMLNRRMRQAPFALAGILIVGSLILLTDIHGKGIGEYPAELQVEVLAKEWAVHIGICGALLFLAMQTAPAGRRSPLESLNAGAWAGRAIIGGYFIFNAVWQWIYFDIRAEHMIATGHNPGSLPVVIGLQLLCGLLVISGRGLWFATPPLMALITLSTIAIHGDLSPTAPYPANLQIHQWFVKASILAGLIMVLGQRAIQPTRTTPGRWTGQVPGRVATV